MMDSKLNEKKIIYPTNDSPLVNPLSIILVKNGSKGDRLLFRYPFKQSLTIEPSVSQTSVQRQFYDTPLTVGTGDNIVTASVQLQFTPAQIPKSMSKYPTSVSSFMGKSPLAKSSPLASSITRFKNPNALPITATATSVKSVKISSNVDIAEDTEPLNSDSEKSTASVVSTNNTKNTNTTASTSSSSSLMATSASVGGATKSTPGLFVPSTTTPNPNPSTTTPISIKHTTPSTPPRNSNTNDILNDLSDKDLSNLLSVTSELAEKKFELKINQVRFVGHPTLMQHPNMKEFYANTLTQQTTTIKIFHIVFCLRAMASHSIVKCFYDLSKRLGVGLRHEEYRCNYLSTEIRKIVGMLDDASHHQELNPGTGGGEHDNIMEDNYFEHLASEILAKSSLAQLMKQVYDDVCKTGFVKLKVNHWVQISFCLPQKIHVLPYRHPPPLVEPENIHKCLEAIRPYHALLLLVDREDLVSSFGVDASSTIPRLLQVYNPLKSLQTIAADADLTLGHVVEIASHLVYWSLAAIIYPICETNVYVIAPDAPISSELTEMEEAFLDRFPGLSLTQTLGDFSIPSQLGELINPVLGGSYVQSQVVHLVCWLLQNHLLIQLHTYIYMITYLDNALNLDPGGNSNINNGQFILDSICPPYFEPEEDEITVSDSYSETTGDDIGASPIPPPLSTHSTASESSTSTVTLVGNALDEDVVDGIPSKRNANSLSEIDEDGINNHNVPAEKLKGTLDELADPVRRALLLVKQPISIQDIKIFSRISKYFNGEYHLEEIMYMENMRRSQVLLVLDKFRDVLITIEKEDADINFFKT